LTKAIAVLFVSQQSVVHCPVTAADVCLGKSKTMKHA